VSLSHDLAPVLGAIHYERDFDINSILRTVAKSLQVKGVKVGGVLQESEFRPNGCCAQLNIVDIRTGKTERITQDRGRESRGCKLDPRGLAAISHCITDAIDADVDLVIINKFGRAESEGDGLLSCIADATSSAPRVWLPWKPENRYYLRRFGGHPGESRFNGRGGGESSC
jgi:hypothetical protein